MPPTGPREELAEYEHLRLAVLELRDTVRALVRRVDKLESPAEAAADGDDAKAAPAGDLPGGVLYEIASTIAGVRDRLAGRSLRLEERLAPLEGRVGRLESRPVNESRGCEWRGVFEQGRTYVPGDLTTRSGSLWLAKRPTSTTPGDTASDWTLVCKRGDSALREVS